MAITFRANLDKPLSYGQMDQNFGSYFYSSSVSQDGATVYLHYTGSANVPIQQPAQSFSLIKGISPARDRRIPFYSGSTSLTTKAGLIVSASAEDDDPNVHVGINIDEERDLPLTYNLEVSGSIRTSAAVFQSSDERLKSNIETIENGLNRILSSRGVTFDRHNGKKEVGVIAQEIQKSIPEVVSEDKNGYLNVNYSSIAGVFIEAIKDQQAQINELKAQIEELKNKG